VSTVIHRLVSLTTRCQIRGYAPIRIRLNKKANEEFMQEAKHLMPINGDDYTNFKLHGTPMPGDKQITFFRDIPVSIVDSDNEITIELADISLSSEESV